MSASSVEWGGFALEDVGREALLARFPELGAREVVDRKVEGGDEVEKKTSDGVCQPALRHCFGTVVCFQVEANHYEEDSTGQRQKQEDHAGGQEHVSGVGGTSSPVRTIMVRPPVAVAGLELQGPSDHHQDDQVGHKDYDEGHHDERHDVDVGPHEVVEVAVLLLSETHQRILHARVGRWIRRRVEELQRLWENMKYGYQCSFIK